MFDSYQAIKNPFGITVFGSALKRVAPDLASLKVTVTRLEPKPPDAFAEAKKASQAVQDTLHNARISEFGASRITLSQQLRFFQGESKSTGYEAKVTFHIRLPELDRVEELLTALISAGANEVNEVSFETTRLKELRAEARRAAVDAALEKAKNYCTAAGVSLGSVLHIEDVNPSALQGNEGSHHQGSPFDLDEGNRAFDPGAISVGAAVYVSYQIQSPAPTSTSP